MKTLLGALFLTIIVVTTGCSESNTDSATDAGSAAGLASCQWHGNCSTTAPHGAYDCNGDSLMQCNNGTWDNVVYCGSTQNSDGDFCTCKGGCGTTDTVCSFAFKICEAHEYETCGPNAEYQITDKAECIPTVSSKVPASPAWPFDD